MDGTSWGGRRNESANTASQPTRMGFVAGWCEAAAELHVVEGVRPGCACGPTGGVDRARVRHGGSLGRGTPARAVRHAMRARRGPDPVRGPTSTTPLGRGSGGGGGGGGGVAVVAGTRPGRRAAPPSSGVVAGRAGTPSHATRGLYGSRGSHGWKGRGPTAVDSTPPGGVPKYPDSDKPGNDLTRSPRDRIRSGAGLFHSGCPNPLTNCLNFSLWRDLSVWRIWGGYFGRRRSGREGVY